MEGNGDHVDDFFVNIFKNFHDIEKKHATKISIFNPKISHNSYDEQKITLGEIEEKMTKGIYEKDYWKFIEHINKAFEIIRQNFTSRSKSFKASNECENVFNERINEFMRKKGYCCAKYRVLHNKKIDCAGASKCIVKQGYVTYKSWIFCENCFAKLPNKDIKLNDETTVNKSVFTYSEYAEKEPEEFVKCAKCKRLQHERCVFHSNTFGVPFTCQSCVKLPRVKQLTISSESIPITESGEFIERYLRASKIEGVDNIVIRMVANTKQKFKPKEIIKEYRPEFKDQTEINYNNCAIFAFLKLRDQTEICFFGVYFQLYGNEKCPLSNRHNVYISFIDSVKLCTIKERTKIYQTILFGVFEYLKLKNFRKVFIWSCPPEKNVDYIFHEKPSKMKMPTKKRLSGWYKMFMTLAKEKKVIETFYNIKEYAEREKWSDLGNIAIFDGDLWPIRLEQAIVDAQKKVAKGTITTKQIIEDIQEFMKIQIDDSYDDYFVIQLTSMDDLIKSAMPDIERGQWISDRCNISDMFQELRLEYSTERLAKYSTYLVLCRFFAEEPICRKCGVAQLGINPNLTCVSCLNSEIKPLSAEKKKIPAQMKDTKLIEIDLTEDDDIVMEIETIERPTQPEEIEELKMDLTTCDDILMVDLTKKYKLDCCIDLTHSGYRMITPVQFDTIDLSE